MRKTLAALALLTASPAWADVPEAVNDHILPGYAAFAAAADALTLAAQESCSPDELKAPFNAAWDAWLGIAHIHMGPVEENGRTLAIAFWPDPKSLGAKAQRALLTGDPAALEPAAFADQSIAARGFPALERLLYSDLAKGADACPLIRATAADLARLAHEVQAGWQGDAGYAMALTGAGQPGNTLYLTEAEARQALFTQLASGLELVADQRLGRPLGTFDKPRPERAEARLSGRSLRQVVLSLQALRALAASLSPQAISTLAAFDRAITLAEGLDDPVLAGTSDPQARLKVEILQQAVQAARDAALAELAPSLGVDIGFNSADGD